MVSGLLIGVERGWQQRGQADGTRVAGVRTFTLIGGFGSLVALIAREVSTAMAAIMLGGLVTILVAGFPRQQAKTSKRALPPW